VNKYSAITHQAKKALWRQFQTTSAVPLDAKGYVSEPEDNLLPGIELPNFTGELGQGGGSELKPRARNGHPMKPKFQAIHSSCALAVNAFGPLKKQVTQWDWPSLGIKGLGVPRFEHKLATGIWRSQANLDVLFDTGTVLLGVESKLIEYLTPKAPHFAPTFEREKLDVEPCWWALLEKYRDETKPQKKLLDEAQLIKHYLGLRRAVGPKGEHCGRSATLLYLFWEPLNASEFPVFAAHRAEIATFESVISASEVRFCSMTYQSLWQDWERQGFISEHVARLQRRYNICMEA
jgi:hypothetical protein